MSNDKDSEGKGLPEDEGYSVGWGKPPRHTQFKKGESGNRKGRPRGAKNATTVLSEELSERVVVSENGRRRRITKLRAAVKQLVNKAASGDHRSAQLLLDEVRQGDKRHDSSPSDAHHLDEEDQSVIRGIVERFQRERKGDGGKGGDSNGGSNAE
jgi:hypothetical protein